MAHTAKVTVVRPCTCAPCARGERWFYCERISANVVAEYMCTPIEEESPSVPHPVALREIEAKHPGMQFIYV